MNPAEAPLMGGIAALVLILALIVVCGRLGVVALQWAGWLS